MPSRREGIVGHCRAGGSGEVVGALLFRGTPANENARRGAEAERMDLSNTLGTVKLVQTAVAVGAAVLVALESIGLIGGA